MESTREEMREMLKELVVREAKAAGLRGEAAHRRAIAAATRTALDRPTYGHPSVRDIEKELEA